MPATVFSEDAEVMPNGQVTLPESVRGALGVESGDYVTFLVEGDTVRIVNPAVYALERLQEQMQGEANRAGFQTEKAVAEWITESRRTGN